jgi:hypothetical protein
MSDLKITLHVYCLVITLGTKVTFALKKDIVSSPNKGKDKGKVHPRTDNEGPEWE